MKSEGRARVILPDESLFGQVKRSLAGAQNCLFAVAYVSNRAAGILEESIRDALKKPDFRLDIVFRYDDYWTEPTALSRLYRLADRARGRLTLWAARDRKFHAKFFGFRTQAKSLPSAIIGSANMTEKAMSIASGELGVFLPPARDVESAWQAMLKYRGKPIREKWIKRYRSRHKKVRKARAGINLPPGPVDPDPMDGTRTKSICSIPPRVPAANGLRTS